MEPRIEYDNPLAPGRPDKVAGSDRTRREDRKRRSSGQRKSKRRGGDKVDADEPGPDSELRTGECLGKRVDFEA
jgi:hypothetical protein